MKIGTMNVTCAKCGSLSIVDVNGPDTPKMAAQLTGEKKIKLAGGPLDGTEAYANSPVFVMELEQESGDKRYLVYAQLTDDQYGFLCYADPSLVPALIRRPL